jgi:prepilin-type N-terminal cleavage/methylation domain-containing protein
MLMRETPSSATMASPRPRRGFSLIEILLAMLILGAVAAGMTRLIVSQTRFYDAESGRRTARTIARSSMNILLSDLRMVHDSGGIDLAAADGKSIRLIVPYRFGLVCGSGAMTTVSMLPADSATVAQSIYRGYGWRNPGSGRYTLVPTSIAPVIAATPTTCTGSGAGEAGIRTVSVAGRTGTILDLSPPSAAAPPASAVFFYQRIVYRFDASGAYPGRIGLWRDVEGGTSDELMAPFDTSARFRFYVAGSDVSTVSPPALDAIRGVEVVLNSQSPKPSAQSGTAQTNMTTSVFFKNVRSF